jgi:hypothetical protein
LAPFRASSRVRPYEIQPRLPTCAHGPLVSVGVIWYSRARVKHNGGEGRVAIGREAWLGRRSLLRGDAEGVDRRVDLHRGEGGLRRDMIGDRDGMIAAGELVVE